MEGSEADTSRTFRRVLLNTCQEEFEGAAAAREVERCPGTICPQHVATIASENIVRHIHIALARTFLQQARKPLQGM